MKIVYLVGDGMGDNPVAALGGKTVLQAADCPTMRQLAAVGTTVLVDTVPEPLAPGSDVANLCLMGYNPLEAYTGRAPIEAAGANIPLAADAMAWRCNLVTVTDGKMADYSAGHISTEEARELMAAIQEALGSQDRTFHAGISYRHLLVWTQGPEGIKTQPPHDIADQPVEAHLPSGEAQAVVRELMEQSKAIFADHPINRKRISEGKAPATQIWLWGQGRSMQLQSFAERYGLHGGIVSAVDLIRGLGVLAGLDAPRIPGATGFIDTNYEGKVAAALDFLDRGGNFAYLHVEAPDECGHMGDPALKQKAIELFDARIVRPVWQALEQRGEPYRIILSMDHRTPVALRGHTRDPVPISVIDGPTGPLEREAAFDEFIDGGVPQATVHEWIRQWLDLRPGRSAG
ncbi:MAG: cofactor-independent phosphoglycerate mutase [Verrucomicrobia bacterium]|nr:cofactor-independent phosphoglycerate mutase [Verrucomicrobiota bacterium]